METITTLQPTIYKTIGGATYVARMHFNKSNKLRIDDKLLRLMGEDIANLE